MKRDFEFCVSVFWGEHFSFLQAKTGNIERLLSYPEKRGENFKSDTKLSQASKARFKKQCNQALHLFFLFVKYTPPRTLSCSYYSKIRYAFDLLQSYFLPNLKNRVLLQLINESHER